MNNLIERLKAWYKSRRLDERPIPEEDPIVKSSLATPIAISSLLLMLTVFWALYEEEWGLRPWIQVQHDFVETYRQILTQRKPEFADEEKAIYESSGYQDLRQQLDQAEEDIRQGLSEIDEKERLLQAQLAAMTEVFITERSRIQAMVYELETTNEEEREDLRAGIEELRQASYDVAVPDGVKSLTYAQLEEEFTSLKAEQGNLQAEKVSLLRRPTEVRGELNQYVQARLTSLTESQVEGLLAGMDEFVVEIKQIHSAEMNLVDRCESCHLGAREPLQLTADDFNGRQEFISHPNQKLLRIHDPEVFGCSPCHNGNGVATVSATKAHGLYKHWLWPLYDKENFEAGCLHCHEADRRLEMAPTLNAGKQLFYAKGCWGCHPREGFDREPRLVRDAAKSTQDLTVDHEETRLLIERTVAQADDEETSNEEANQLYAAANRLTLSLADIDAQVDRLKWRSEELMMEEKRVGPDLKEIRLKLKREWIPIWIENPQAFRPNTKMPHFRLEEDQIHAVAAFLWQSAIDDHELPNQPAGDAGRGKSLFESRGCMACHSVGEGDQASGGTFAANLSRVGEKANYEYLVRWVHNPRERTYPYCPVHKRDIKPDDYASQGLPFRFDLENNQCPLGDHPLHVQQPTVMPSLRLTPQEARDISTYLVSLKRDDAQYPPAPYLDDPQLFDQGRDLVRHYGCRGCHEIAGLEDEGKIGTDLTQEGSKPIERLDFALLTKEAKHEGWYNHKGFFERKLRNPDIFDLGKENEPLEKLRMPDFHLSDQQIVQLTTYLLGSVDETRIPEQFFHHPPDQRSHIQEGWWVVTKYNCVGCHQFTASQDATALEGLSQYDSPDGRDKLPPSLVGQGARTNPDWLAGFLKNPSLRETDMHRNGVRPYLQVRMPTFNLSNGEIHKLIRFFSALSSEPLPFASPQLEELTGSELTMARDLFTHTAAPCLRCHATGDAVTDRDATAPNFLLVPERLKSDWTRRWIVHPEIIRPGTAMPSGLFRQDGDRSVFALADVPSLRRYDRDHAELLVRYMFQYTPEEQRRLARR